MRPSRASRLVAKVRRQLARARAGSRRPFIVLVLKAVSQPGWIRDAQKHDWGKMSKEVSSSQFSPRSRWLPQAVYRACAEGRITARMDSNGFGIVSPPSKINQVS